MTWYWKNTLEQFLASSNEDACYEQVFMQILNRFLPQLQDLAHVEWIDVGPGPGSKTEKFADCLMRYLGPDFLEINLIEPDPFWNDALAAIIDKRKGRQRDRIWLWNEDAAVFSNRKIPAFNILTAIQVLYDNAADEGIARLIAEHSNNQCAIVIFGMESPNSDTRRIRDILHQQGFNVPIPRTCASERALREGSWNIEEISLESKNLRISENSNASIFPDWFLPFLLGQESTDYVLREADHKLLSKVVCDFMNGRTFFSIPDRVVLGWKC